MWATCWWAGTEPIFLDLRNMKIDKNPKLRMKLQAFVICLVLNISTANGLNAIFILTKPEVFKRSEDVASSWRAGCCCLIDYKNSFINWRRTSFVYRACIPRPTVSRLEAFLKAGSFLTNSKSVLSLVLNVC